MINVNHRGRIVSREKKNEKRMKNARQSNPENSVNTLEDGN